MIAKRRLYLLGTLAILAGGCRAVLGIDALDVIEAGAGEEGGAPDATRPSDDSGASKDTGAIDATFSPDAGNDAGGISDANPIELPDCAPLGSGCNKCCRSDPPLGEHTLEQYSIEAGCLCSPTSPCASDCNSTAFCNGTGQPPPTSGTCGMCVGSELGSDASACVAAQRTCLNDPACAPVLRCLATCPPP